MVRKLDYLYHKGIYQEELRKFLPSTPVLLDSLRTFKRLQARQKEKIFGDLTETQLEQSFNEQVFCRAFGYDSQFMKAAGQFHVLPKVYMGSQYNDFSLGYSNGSTRNQFVSKTTVELKGPNADLEDGAIAQAFKYARTSSAVEWVLACNFREIFIFDKSDKSKGLYFDLTQVTDSRSAKRILFPIAAGAFFNLDGTIGRLEKIRRRVKWSR